MNRQVNNLSGQRFGRLVVASFGGAVSGNSKWICVCDCGSISVPFATTLKSGKTTSCGCFRRENLSVIKRKHGASLRDEYNTWKCMISRCTNPSIQGYADYGGRGISVCKRWIDSIENFIADIGERPSKSHSLDRIDVDGNYEPSNCRWATAIQQQNNKRNNKHITHNGKTMTHQEWNKEIGAPRPGLVNLRIRRGWSPERAVTTGVKTK
jgi:hypothetical protein